MGTSKSVTTPMGIESQVVYFLAVHHLPGSESPRLYWIVILI